MNINDILNDIGKKSLIASNQVKNFTSEEKNNLLMKIAEKINLDKELINSRYKEINIQLNEIEKKLNNKSVSKKHLIWISKMLEYDIAGE